MKRPLLAALAIGLIAVVLFMIVRAIGLFDSVESGVASLLSGNGAATQSVSDKLQYLLVLVLAGGVAWMVLLSNRRRRLAGIVAILLFEFLVLAWVCSLFRVLFQPLPSLLGGGLGFAGAMGFMSLQQRQKLRGSRPRPAPVSLPRHIVDEPPAPVVAPRPIAPEKRAPVNAPEPAPTTSSASAAQLYEVTAVVCDIGNKHDLADDWEPAQFAELTEKFIGHAMKIFRAAGAYIESFGGEGVVAIFGFPASDPQHAEKATRTAMGLAQSFAESSDSEAFASAGVHAGVSSGTMVMAPVKTRGQASMLAIGEPVELARRFCIANRFYGSRVLIGLRTFDLASKILVARPIDFLSGVDMRERHEIYEPITLALEATPEIIRRRDFFWNGLVLYREKRWAEAYTQFQKARGPNDQDDQPLQLYLRRLEPLALQLTEEPLNL
ncbi:MAG: adenylate/guanylate cyclase domain-containing protein [Verrucomicrobiota bacterium]